MEKQSCFNCKHFVQYYRKRLTELAPVNCGHCRVRKFSAKEKKPPLKCCCEQWLPSLRNNTRKEEIERVLEKMQAHLEQIAILLQNENEP